MPRVSVEDGNSSRGVKVKVLYPHSANHEPTRSKKKKKNFPKFLGHDSRLDGGMLEALPVLFHKRLGAERMTIPPPLYLRLDNPK